MTGDYINGVYHEDPIIQSFLTFVKNNRKGVFLYLDNREVEKTSDKAEQHFSVQSWLLITVSIQRMVFQGQSTGIICTYQLEFGNVGNVDFAL